MKKKLQLEPLYATCVKKGLSTREEAKRINDVGNSGTVNKRVVKNWFRHFKKGDISPKDKPRSRRPSVVEDESLLEMVGQQPSTSTCTLSVELGQSKTPSINTSIRSAL